jgi:hypothetical protein
MESNGKLLEQQARQRLGMPENWQVFNWDSVLDDERRIVAYQLTGAVIPIGRKGSRLGCRDYAQKDATTVRTVTIEAADHEAWAEAWEARTGLCRTCLGSGRDMELVYRGTPGECRRCRGTGGAMREAG